MHPLGPLRSLIARVASPRARWRKPLVLVLLGMLPSVVQAQLTLTHTEDAAPVPQGALRFRMTSGSSPAVDVH
jgi:hypothetical protein